MKLVHGLFDLVLSELRLLRVVVQIINLALCVGLMLVDSLEFHLNLLSWEQQLFLFPLHTIKLHRQKLNLLSNHPQIPRIGYFQQPLLQFWFFWLQLAQLGLLQCGSMFNARENWLVVMRDTELRLQLLWSPLQQVVLRGLVLQGFRVDLGLCLL